MLVSPSRIHYSSLESLEGFFSYLEIYVGGYNGGNMIGKKIPFFYFVYKHPYFDSFQPCIWTKSRIFLLLDISLQIFCSNNFLKCILSLFISQHHKINKVSFDTSEISLLMMLSFWMCYKSFLDTYWHFNLLATEVKSSVSLFNKDDINICHVCT